MQENEIGRTSSMVQNFSPKTVYIYKRDNNIILKCILK
jgi:hypothetical protein